MAQISIDFTVVRISDDFTKGAVPEQAVNIKLRQVHAERPSPDTPHTSVSVRTTDSELVAILSRFGSTGRVIIESEES